MSGPKALDVALQVVPGAYAWASQRIREVQAAPERQTESSLLRGFGAVSKRVQILADEVQGRVRKSGGGLSNETALRQVLGEGDFGTDDTA